MKKRKFVKPTGFSLSQDTLYVSNNNGKLRLIRLDSGEIIKDIKISGDSSDFLSRKINEEDFFRQGADGLTGCITFYNSDVKI